MKKIFPVIILCSMFSLAFGQEVWDRVLAIVDDNIILESEVLMYAQSLALQSRVDPIKYLQNEEIKDQILKELIDQQVLLAKAKEDTVVVEDREVDREMENRLKVIIEEVGSEEGLERVYGMSIREIRREFRKTIREALMVDRVKQVKMMGVKVSRAEVEEFFKEHKKELSDLPESVEIAHILLKVKPSVDAEERAFALADSLFEVIQGGGDFEELAGQFSQDPGTKKKRGLLGWTERGDFVPEFEKAAFELDTGKVSPPVKTRFGYHIIRLNERMGEKINTSHILIRLQPTDDDQERVMALADSIYERLLGGADFAELANKYSQDEETAAEGGELGTFALKELVKVYAEKLKELKPGDFTEPFKSDMGIQVLKLSKRDKPRPLTLKDDWEKISQFALNAKREKIYQEWLAKLKERVYIEVKE